MLTEKDYCDYEASLALKELGYPLRSKEVRYEDKAVFVPGVLLYSAQKWLREEKVLHIDVRWCCNMWHEYEYKVKEAEGKVIAEGSAYKTYEDALSTAIYMATEHLKEKQNRSKPLSC